jgi:carbon monoxide dehydrogenase subunit G
MRIETGFRLGMPVDEAWPVLLDLERVAPCMPGVTVQSSENGRLHATMRVKVGPVTASYRTTVSLESADENAHCAVLRVSGREARGPGTVEAKVTAALTGEGDASAVALATDLDVTGKVAQLGGGVLGEVADRLLQQFASRLEADLARPESGEVATPVPAPAASEIAPPIEEEPLDLGQIAFHAVAAKLRLAGLAGLLVFALGVLRRRRR